MSGGWKTTRGLVIVVPVLAAALLVITIDRARGILWRGHVVPTPAPHVAARRIDVTPQKTSVTALPVAPTAATASGQEVCGLGRVPLATADAEDINQYVGGVTRKAYDRWEAALLDSSDSRARAVGLMFKWAEFRRSDSTVQADESRDELVQLAAGGADPAVYAIAVGLCRTYLTDPETEGACARLSLSGWTRADPDNAEPWIAVAQAARSSGDTPAEASAFERAAAAHTMNNSGEPLLSVALAEMPQDVTALEKAALTIQLIGYTAAWVPPGFKEISQYCSAEAVKRNKTRDECNAVAELMVSHGGTILNSMMGGRIGERVGWPADRVSRILGEREAMLGLDPIDEHNPWSCQSVYRVNAYMERRVQVGEREARREQLEHAAAAAGN